MLQRNKLNYLSYPCVTRSISTKSDYRDNLQADPSASQEKLVDLRGQKCPGCGSKFQSSSEEKFGYTLERKLIDVPISQVKSLICQRCFCLNHYKSALNMTMSEEDWRHHMQRMPKEGAIAVLVVDVFDFPNSMFPNLLELIGHTMPIIILVNKTDLLIEDGPHLKERIQDMVWQGCKDTGLAEGNLVDICLVR